MDAFAALLTGLVIGLALVVPLGAIGLLLLQEGATLGWQRGVPAAVAVASVDLIYCIIAVVAGAAVSPLISSWGEWPKAIGGSALVVLAISNLIRAHGFKDKGSADRLSANTRLSQRYVLFFGLTAMNPATLLYFAATVTGFSQLMSSPVSAIMFVLGVAVASLSWQLLLVFVGSVVYWKAGARFRGITTVVGNCAVCALGVLMIVGAL